MGHIKEIIVLFKTHLDIGYTDFAENVQNRYLHSYIPKALELAKNLREQEGERRFVRTTGSWLIDTYLRSAGEEERSAMEAAIAAGDISWHGLPFTTHTELMDPDLVRYGIGIAKRLDRQYGRASIAAKLTDVPGHTRALVSLLADAGIEFLHIGVNPTSVNPDVPPLFRWRAPDGKEITVMYQFGYGGFSEIPGTGKALMFAHTGDNNGPQSADSVLDVYRRLKEEYPEAVIRPGDLNDIALAVREIRGTLPVVTQEIGDTWIHGGQTDPRKMNLFRALLRARRAWTDEARDVADRWLIMVPEHTWGLDSVPYLRDHENYGREGFRQARSTPRYQKMEQSWEEQRDYLRRLIDELPESEKSQAETLRKEYCRKPEDFSGYRKIESPTSMLSKNNWQIRFDASGALDWVRCQETQVADKQHKIGVFCYEAFSRTETDRFFKQYVDLSHFPQLEEFAVEDFNKLGTETAISQYLRAGSSLSALYEWEGGWLAQIKVENSPATLEYGCPAELALWVRPLPDRLELDFAWWNKPATRVPEAVWLGMNPVSQTCRIHKLGQWVDALDVVKFGGQKLHGTDRGVRFDHCEVETLDTPLVQVGELSMWDFTDTPPKLTAGIWFNLYNNMWNTNFPLWYDEDARFRFVIHLEP